MSHTRRQSRASPAAQPGPWRRRGRWWLSTAVVLALVVAVWAAFHFSLVRWIYRDGEEIWDSRERLSIRSVLWSAPRELGDRPGAKPDGGDTGAAGPSGLTAASLLVALKSPAGDYDICVRNLTPAGWTAPAPLGGREAAIHSRSDEITPQLSADGTVLYFASNRDRGLGGYDLYASRLGAGGPEPPIHLGSHVNSPFDETGPAPHPSGRLLVFATDRPRSFLHTPPAHWDDVLLERWQPGDEELAYAIAPAGGELRRGWSDPRPLFSITSAASDTTPAFSPGGTFLYFSSDRPLGHGGLDLYRARCRVRGLDPDEVTALEADAPQNVGAPVNSRLDDSQPSLFLEGFALAYRIRNPESGAEAFFESRSHEVAPELSFAAIPLEVITAHVVRIGGMVLSGLGLALLTVVVLRYRPFWRWSLSVRCSVAALLIHLGLFYGFYLWRVGSDIARLRPKTVLAEVTVERSLQARLTLEAQRMRIELPEAEPQPTRRERRTEIPRAAPSPAAPLAARTFAVSSLEARPEPLAPELATAPPLESPQRPASKTAPVNVRLEARFETPLEPLPQADPAPRVTEPESLPDGTARSIKVETSRPRPGPVATVVENATPTSKALETPVQAARTQVQAPLPPPRVMPPLARAELAAPDLVHELPVPAQSSEREAPVALEPEAASTPATALAPQGTGETGVTAVRVEVDTRPRPLVRWSAAPMGLARVREEIAAATEFEAAPPNPWRTLAPIAATAERLPEPAATGETTASRPESLASPLAPRPAEKRHARAQIAARAQDEGAPLLTARTLPEMKPKAAPANTNAIVSAASPAALRQLPAPGALAPRAMGAPAQTPHHEVVLPVGEGARSPGSGAQEVADVLGPRAPRARLRKLSFAARESAAASRAPAPLVDAGLRTTAVAGGPSPAPLAVPRPPPPAATAAAAPALPDAARDVAPGTALARTLPEMAPRKAAPDLRQVRSEPSRKVLVETMGGTPASEAAVQLGLEWLARGQSTDGRWDVDGFRSHHGTPGFQTRCDVAVTALSVLCFLGQNHTPDSLESPYRRHVAKGLQWLLRVQRSDGLLAGEDRKFVMYNHGIATLALSEAYILSGDETLREPLERAASVILRAQNPRTGGWRYQPTPPLRGDTSISGWQIMALTSLRNAGIELPERAFDLARHWLDEEVSSGRHRGIYGYTKPEEARVAMVAEGMFVRQLLGARRTQPNIEEAARFVHTRTSRDSRLDNLYLVYYGTMGLFQYQGWIWERWNTEVREFLVRTQNKRGLRAGSWDPTGPWSEAGGSVLSTCFAVLTLQVYYRYLPLFWQAKPAAPPRD